MAMNATKLTRVSASVLAGALALAACSSDDESTIDDESSTDAEATSASSMNYLGDYTLDDAEFGTHVTVTVADGVRNIETNALPDHETGEFPNQGNPNTISAQNLSYQYPTEPTWTGDATFARTPGVAVNGVKFEPATAESVSCASGEEYRIEALQDVYDLGLDFNNAHVQPTGEYHYHGISELLADAYGTDDDLVMVGFAADGYLMYYSKSGAYSSGFAISDEPRSGTDCVASGPAGGDSIDIEGTTPDGTYTSDWVWSADNGDLDSCNGIEIDGTYAYVVTDEYPFVGRCLNGETDEAGGPPPDGAAPGSDAGAVQPGPGQGPDFTDAAAALGVSVEELEAALGGPPPDLEAAAETLGVSVEELRAVMPPPPG